MRDSLKKCARVFCIIIIVWAGFVAVEGIRLVGSTDISKKPLFVMGGHYHSDVTYLSYSMSGITLEYHLMPYNEFVWGEFKVLDCTLFKWNREEIRLGLPFLNDSEDTISEYPTLLKRNNDRYRLGEYELGDEVLVELDIIEDYDEFIAYCIIGTNDERLVGCTIYASEEIADYVFVLYEGEYLAFELIEYK